MPTDFTRCVRFHEVEICIRIITTTTISDMIQVRLQIRNLDIQEPILIASKSRHQIQSIDIADGKGRIGMVHPDKEIIRKDPEAPMSIYAGRPDKLNMCKLEFQLDWGLVEVWDFSNPH
jgi:hypothetical protein